jgi:hypothetical protein
MIHERQDWTEEGLSRRTMITAAAGLWGAGLLVGALGIWRANTPLPTAAQRAATDMAEQRSAPQSCSMDDDMASGETTDAVTGALVFPDDVLVASPRASHRRGAAEMQKH